MPDKFAVDQLVGPVLQRRRNFAFVMKLIPGIQVIADSIALILCGLIPYYVLVYYSYKTVDFYYLAVCFNWLVSVMLFHFGGLYQFGAVLRPWKVADRIIIGVLTSFLMMLAAAFSIKISEAYSRVWIAAFFFGCVVGLLLERTALSRLIWKLGKNNVVARNVAVIGVGAQSSQLLDFLGMSQPAFFNIAGVYIVDGRRGGFDSRYPIRGNLDDLLLSIRNNDVDDVIVAMPWSEDRQIAGVIEKLRELPTNVLLSADLAGFNFPMSPPPSYFESLPLYQVVGKPLTGWDVIIKSLEDYVLGTALLILLAPFLLAVALLIKLDSKGPVLFRQKRLGFNNQNFDIFKFRTMVYSEQPEEKTNQARLNDPRVTRIGRFLTKWSIDELPQLLNVLNGTMSLVGPRPHAIDHNTEYSQRIRGYFSRHRVKPGITGLAQVKGFRGQTDTLEKMEGRVRYDVQYAETWSPTLDLRILILTPFTVIWGKNAF